MSTRNRILAVAALAAGASLAQEPAVDPRSSLKINMPKDSPVTLVSADWGESKASARGGAMVLDLHTSLMLRNSGQRRIRGVTLLVLAQEVTPGGKGSVSVPSLDVAAGEVFPLRIDLRLLRPLAPGAGPLVEVRLDGVLFDDLSFFGDNRLNSKRSMTLWEMEARRDRRHFKSILEARGPDGLQQEVLAALAREAERPRLDVQMARGGRATVIEGERQVQFSFLRLPGAPVEPVAGLVRVAANEARAPMVEVRNRSDRAVRFLEIGWIIRDRQGREYMAGSMPAEVSLGAGEKNRLSEAVSLKFSARPGDPLSIDGVTGFVSHAEFVDGEVWIPSRADLAEPRMASLAPPSPEEQRLLGIYRKRGLKALTDELKKY
jgi:hypothetical protein